MSSVYGIKKKNKIKNQNSVSLISSINLCLWLFGYRDNSKSDDDDNDELTSSLFICIRYWASKRNYMNIIGWVALSVCCASRLIRWRIDNCIEYTRHVTKLKHRDLDPLDLLHNIAFIINERFTNIMVIISTVNPIPDYMPQHYLYSNLTGKKNK